MECQTERRLRTRPQWDGNQGRRRALFWEQEPCRVRGSSVRPSAHPRACSPGFPPGSAGSTRRPAGDAGFGRLLPAVPSGGSRCARNDTVNTVPRGVGANRARGSPCTPCSRGQRAAGDSHQPASRGRSAPRETDVGTVCERQTCRAWAGALRVLGQGHWSSLCAGGCSVSTVTCGFTLRAAAVPVPSARGHGDEAAPRPCGPETTGQHRAEKLGTAVSVEAPGGQRP